MIIFQFHFFAVLEKNYLILDKFKNTQHCIFEQNIDDYPHLSFKEL